MQQTETYKLNLIESTDTFSPAPLNENMQAIEGVLAEQAASLKGQAETLNKLAAAALKIAMGTYTGTGTYGSDSKNSLAFGFQPKLVLVMGGAQSCLFLRGFGSGLGHSCVNGDADRLVQTAAWNGNTLTWYIHEAIGDSGSYQQWATHQLNEVNTTYHYLAIG